MSRSWLAFLTSLVITIIPLYDYSFAASLHLTISPFHHFTIPHLGEHDGLFLELLGVGEVPGLLQGGEGLLLQHVDPGHQVRGQARPGGLDHEIFTPKEFVHTEKPPKIHRN